MYVFIVGVHWLFEYLSEPEVWQGQPYMLLSILSSGQQSLFVVTYLSLQLESVLQIFNINSSTYSKTTFTYFSASSR
jgi:hypothetical protein